MISVYVHVPFCAKKCLYCGFYSTVYSTDWADIYLDGLRREAELLQSVFHRSSCRTLYIGGGTPTCLSHEQLGELFSIVRSIVPNGQEIERTVEANPGFLSDPVLALLREQGVTRLSIGVQSLDDRHLMALGRGHTANDAVATVGKARRSGFRNIALDLIYGIPGQDAGSWRMTLENAVALNPEHIAVYALSLDEGSAFKRMAEEGTFVSFSDDAAARLYEIAVQLLERAGYRQYELSNFSRPGRECAHNMNYWHRGEYVGLGPGAWSFLGERRSSNCRDIERYARKLKEGFFPVDEVEQLSGEEAAREYLMLRLRTSGGVDLPAFERLHGTTAFKRLMRNAEEAGSNDLFTMNGERISLSPRGRLLADRAILQLCS